MAKADKFEVKVIPQEALIIFAGIAAHALIANNAGYSEKEVAEYAFDTAEAIMAEARKRGYTTQ